MQYGNTGYWVFKGGGIQISVVGSRQKLGMISEK